MVSQLDRTSFELLISACYLHDIGYSPVVARTGFHSLDGARYLQGVGVSDRLCGLVAHHSCAMLEAQVRGLSDELSVWSDEKTVLRDALWWADMTTTPNGRVTTIEGRIKEIRRRYGPKSPVSIFICQAESELIAAVERTEARLRAAGVEVR